MSASDDDVVAPVFDATKTIEARVREGSIERITTNTTHNRETGIFPVIPGDVYDRQRCVDGWDLKNRLVEATSAFVVGTGGVGTNAAFALTRMGVGELTLLDMDTVDATNLNRQILFNKNDVGRRKVDAAKDNLDAFHNLSTEVTTMHMDAIRNWDAIVARAKKATMIVNAIDYGAVADKALASLAFKLGIPYLTASTYGNVFQNEFFTGRAEDVCWRSTQEGNMAASADMFQAHLDARGLDAIDAAAAIEILTKECKVTSALAHDKIAEWMGDQSLDAAAFYNDIIRAKFNPWVDDMLHPNLILDYDAIDFIPYDAHDTRGQGSWVGVCTIGSLMSINLWLQFLLGYPTITSSSCDLRHFSQDPNTMIWDNFYKFQPQPEASHPWADTIQVDEGASADSDA